MTSWLGFGQKPKDATAAAAQAAAAEAAEAAQAAAVARDAALAAQPAIDRVNRITDAFIGTYLDPVYALLNQNLKILVFSSPTKEGAEDALKDTAITNRIKSNDELYGQIKVFLQRPFPETKALGANAAARNVPVDTFPFINPKDGEIDDASVMQMLACMYGEKDIKDCSAVASVPTWYFYYPLKNTADITPSLCFKKLLAPIIALTPVVAAQVEDINACDKLAAEYERQTSVAEGEGGGGGEGGTAQGGGSRSGGRRPKGRKTRGKKHPKRRGSRRH